MASNQILGRIRVKHLRGADLLYSTDFHTLENFGIEHDTELQDLRVIKIGTRLTIDGIVFEVESMYTYFHDETHRIDTNIGVNIYGDGESNPFNFMVTYYVKAV